jgi:hypothetical protein
MTRASRLAAVLEIGSGAGRREETMHMRVGIERIAAVVSLAAAAFIPAAAAEAQLTPRKIEIKTFTCDGLATLERGEQRDRVLIYLNGYLDGTRKATIWDEALVGKRIDEAMRLCKANPRLSLLEAFRRAWAR